MKRATYIATAVVCLSIPAFAQQAPSPQPPPPSKPIIIGVPAEMQGALQAVEKDLEIARLKKANVILQLRLLLQVPNDYEWNDIEKRFDAPKASESPVTPNKPQNPKRER